MLTNSDLGRWDNRWSQQFLDPMRSSLRIPDRRFLSDRDQRYLHRRYDPLCFRPIDANRSRPIFVDDGFHFGRSIDPRCQALLDWEDRNHQRFVWEYHRLQWDDPQLFHPELDWVDDDSLMVDWVDFHPSPNRWRNHGRGALYQGHDN